MNLTYTPDKNQWNNPGKVEPFTLHNIKRYPAVIRAEFKGNQKFIKVKIDRISYDKRPAPEWRDIFGQCINQDKDPYKHEGNQHIRNKRNKNCLITFFIIEKIK